MTIAFQILHLANRNTGHCNENIQLQGKRASMFCEQGRAIIQTNPLVFRSGYIVIQKAEAAIQTMAITIETGRLAVQHTGTAVQHKGIAV